MEHISEENYFTAGLKKKKLEYKDISCSWVGRYYTKLSIFLRKVYKLYAIPNRICKTTLHYTHFLSKEIQNSGL